MDVRFRLILFFILNYRKIYRCINVYVEPRELYWYRTGKNTDKCYKTCSGTKRLHISSLNKLSSSDDATGTYINDVKISDWLRYRYRCLMVTGKTSCSFTPKASTQAHRFLVPVTCLQFPWFYSASIKLPVPERVSPPITLLVGLWRDQRVEPVNLFVHFWVHF